MGTLQGDTKITRGGDGGMIAELSRNWEIWGPNGGYVASIALRAAGMVAPPAPSPGQFFLPISVSWKICTRRN